MGMKSMAGNFIKINGVVTLLGNAIATNQAKNYTVIEIQEKNGEITTLQNVAISTTLDNYLNTGDEAELYLVKFYNKERYPLYIYGIKKEGRRVNGFIPSAFSKQKNGLILIGVIMLGFIITIPIGLYLFWLASKKSSVINKMKADIDQ